MTIMSKSKSNSVFISYGTSDRQVASDLGLELAKLGVTVVDGRKIEPGDQWRAKIASAIKDASTMVVVVDKPEAAGSGWVSYEAGVAAGLGKPVVVVASNKYSVTDLPADLAAQQVVQVNPSAPAAAAREVTTRLKSVFDKLKTDLQPKSVTRPAKA